MKLIIVRQLDWIKITIPYNNTIQYQYNSISIEYNWALKGNCIANGLNFTSTFIQRKLTSCQFVYEETNLNAQYCYHEIEQ